MKKDRGVKANGMTALSMEKYAVRSAKGEMTCLQLVVGKSDGMDGVVDKPIVKIPRW
jgi:hypothetical protein